MPTLRKLSLRGGGITHYTTKVENTNITLTTTSIERIFNLKPDLSKFPRLMSSAKAHKIYLRKYTLPYKINKTNQSYVALYSDSHIIYYIFVRTIYPQDHPRRPPITTFLRTSTISWRGYSVDFVELTLDYMTKVCNLSRNFPLPYSNILAHIFKIVNLSLEVEDRLNT